MQRFMLCLLIVGTFAVPASASSKEVSEIAYEIARKEMSEANWKSHVRKARQNFETWSNDNNDGSMKRYLDDKLVQIAPAALSGDVKDLKRLVFWIALYVEFGEQQHSRLQEVALTHGEDFEEVLADFSWERAAQKIKMRKKKADENNRLVMKK
ncbi:MAG TPA: hypothetical protein VEK08_09850 [Planctomycetota bacterium]|nr:hypothetical protein [Planctomycetota bacterium]